MSSHQVAIIGTGYVGLTTGACLAHLGHNVVCVDNDEHKLEMIRGGVLPIKEDGLDDLVSMGMERKTLQFTTSLKDAVANAEFVFLCLPTPSKPDGSADTSSIESVVLQIRDSLKVGTVVVNKSTVPISSASVIQVILNRSDVYVVSNPEFLREGTAVKDFLEPDRIVVGFDHPDAGLRVADLYKPVDRPVVLTDSVSAETIKYFANAYLAMRISFINEVAMFCSLVDADVFEVIRGLSHDSRIGSTFLSPGPGWGGSCFPKDTRAITFGARQLGSQLSLIEAAIEANSSHQERIVEMICEKLGESSTDEKVALLGLAFKAGTDDVRESPALLIARELADRGYRVVAYDPANPKLPAELAIETAESVLDALWNADLAIVATEWSEFSDIPAAAFRTTMRGNIIFDLRYILDPLDFTSEGLEIISIGRRISSN